MQITTLLGLSPDQIRELAHSYISITCDDDNLAVLAHAFTHIVTGAPELVDAEPLVEALSALGVEGLPNVRAFNDVRALVALRDEVRTKDYTIQALARSLKDAGETIEALQRQLSA